MQLQKPQAGRACHKCGPDYAGAMSVAGSSGGALENFRNLFRTQRIILL